MKSFWQRWFVTTLGVLVAANVVDGIRSDSIPGLLVASFILGIFNALLRPVMLFLSLPLLILSLGLFVLVINAILFYLVGWLVTSLHVASFWAAFKAGVVVSIVSFFASFFIGKKDSIAESKNPGPPPRTSGGSGPVIDI